MASSSDTETILPLVSPHPCRMSLHGCFQTQAPMDQIKMFCFVTTPARLSAAPARVPGPSPPCAGRAVPRGTSLPGGSTSLEGGLPAACTSEGLGLWVRAGQRLGADLGAATVSRRIPRIQHTLPRSADRSPRTQDSTFPCGICFQGSRLNPSGSLGGSRWSEGLHQEKSFRLGRQLSCSCSAPASPRPLLRILGGPIPVSQVARRGGRAEWLTGLQFAQRGLPPHTHTQRLRWGGAAQAGARAGVRGLSQASLSNVKAIKATSSVRSGRASGSGAAATTHLTGALLHRGCAGHAGPRPAGRGPRHVHLELARGWSCHPWGVPASWATSLPGTTQEARREDSGLLTSLGPARPQSPHEARVGGGAAVCPPPPLEPQYAQEEALAGRGW